jgi:hypothetical protein
MFFPSCGICLDCFLLPTELEIQIEIELGVYFALVLAISCTLLLALFLQKR